MPNDNGTFWVFMEELKSHINFIEDLDSVLSSYSGCEPSLIDKIDDLTDSAIDFINEVFEIEDTDLLSIFIYDHNFGEKGEMVVNGNTVKDINSFYKYVVRKD